MPANLTPQYLEAEAKYKQCRDPEEKLLALEEMLRTLPKHKGTEKIYAEIKRKISEQKKEIASEKGKKKKPSFYVDSHGNPQIVVIGPPNSGKSKFISQITGADLKVADYPFTTVVPQPAMMKFENVPIQLVDTPPIDASHMEPWMPNIIRGGNSLILMADLASDTVLEDIEFIISILEKQRIYMNAKQGEREDGDTIKNTLLVANKNDLGKEIFPLVQESFGKRFECLAVSSTTGESLELFKKKAFLLLNIVRIYPKPPGKKPDRNSPILLKKGSTIVDLAESIHHEMAQKLKSARIWGSSSQKEEYKEGQMVPRDYVIQDEDIIELVCS